MIYKVLKMLSIGFLISGCYVKPKLSNKIFDEVCVINKPEIKTLKDAQNAYIDLFKAYESNLKLLEIIKEAH